MPTSPLDDGALRQRLAGASLLVLAAVAGGCGKSVLTPSIVSEYGLTAGAAGSERWRSLQVYTSDDLTLQRTTTEAQDNNDKLVELERNEQVEIPSGTPGAILEIEIDQQGRLSTVVVGFDPAAKDKTLRFGLKAVDETIEDNPYELLPSRARVVTYGGKDYSLKTQSMWRTHLLFDGQQQVQQDSSESPPGWRVTGPGAQSSP